MEDTLTINLRPNYPNIYGYFDPKYNEINLCELYYNAPMTGENSKMGTIVHEMSHAAAKTEDHEYGHVKCLSLAINDQDKACNNADNFEYYCEELLDSQ